MTLPYLILSVALLTANASGDPRATAPSAQPALGQLEYTSWKAVELAGTPVPQKSAPNREPHLVFGAQGHLSGADGCNLLAGPYTVKGNGLTFGQIAGTRIHCPGTDEVARRFHAALTGTSHWRIADNRLQLYGATGRPLAVFERSETGPSASAPPLQGTSWQLINFKGGDGRTLTPNDRTKYTIAFAEGGQLSARVDCNRGHGTWKATGSGELELGPLALTGARCPDPSLHDQIAKHWGSIRSFTIKDGHLFLSVSADGGIYEFEPAIVKKL